MKHRQTGVGKVRTINSDGHSIGLDLGATSVRAAILTPGTVDGRPTVTVHGIGLAAAPTRNGRQRRGRKLRGIDVGVEATVGYVRLRL